MDNKGFAITGIIYTLFILFLMILISVLSGIRIMQRSASDSVYKLKEEVEKVEKVDGSNYDDLINDNKLILPTGDGKYYKYEFKVDGRFEDDSASGMEQQIKVMCSTYISKDTEWENVVFSPKDCNEYQSVKDAIIAKREDAKLIGVYEFKGW